MAGIAVQADGLVKLFGQQRAVDGIDLAIHEGEVFAFLGPNGAGKTTTIRMLATLLKPDGGKATVFGYDVVRQARQVRQLIGLTGQYASVDESLSATENLVLFGRLDGLSAKDSRNRAASLLDDFDLAEAASKPLKHFSGGMRRRLDLAASLISRPPLIFLDEPTTGLDPRTRGQMWQTIRALVAAGATVLLTTQYLDEADQLANRIAVIDHGRLVGNGTPAELKASVGSSTLQLHLSNVADMGRAALAVEQAVGVVPAITAGRLVAPLANANAAGAALTALRDQQISISSVSVDQPTLDQVFMAITGHGADDVQQPTKEFLQ
jgi:ABC-2 type transport system ATP-binding protein